MVHSILDLREYKDIKEVEMPNYQDTQWTMTEILSYYKCSSRPQLPYAYVHESTKAYPHNKLRHIGQNCTQNWVQLSLIFFKLYTR